ncbi:NUDIX hydrolase [Aquimarina rhabdastrellae]
MTFEAFKNLIPKIQKMSVPGVFSHEVMAPDIRKKELNNIKIDTLNPREAAVMMLCYPKQHELYLALILRPTYNGVHSAQVALPGGKVEQEDANHQEAALREMNEEIGVPQDIVEVIKPLTRVYIPPSNFWVYPFLGYTDQLPQFDRQIEEVDKIIEIPLADLLDETNVISEILTTSYANKIEVPSFKLDGYTVWGATAMMLSELKILMKQVKAL